MNKIIQTTLVVIFTIAVLASIAGNIYYFGWLNLQNYLETQGAKAEYNYLLNQSKAQQNSTPPATPPTKVSK